MLDRLSVRLSLTCRILRSAALERKIWPPEPPPTNPIHSHSREKKPSHPVSGGRRRGGGRTTTDGRRRRTKQRGTYGRFDHTCLFPPHHLYSVFARLTALCAKRRRGRQGGKACCCLESVTLRRRDPTTQAPLCVLSLQLSLFFPPPPRCVLYAYCIEVDDRWPLFFILGPEFPVTFWQKGVLRQRTVPEYFTLAF